MTTDATNGWARFDGAYMLFKRNRLRVFPGVPAGPAMRSKRIASFVGLISMGLLAACAVQPDPAEIAEGDSREAILQTYGEPAGRQKIKKEDEAIWGPIEDFWYKIPIGSRVEIWSYPAEDGDVELYFVDDSPTVDGVGFAPEGVVYEAVQN